MPFTQNFNYCMEQKKYTAYKFSKIIGASNQGVLNWQSGECIPYPKTKKKIADHFGITLAELDGDDLPVLPKKGAEKAPDPKIEGADDKIVQFIRSASAEELTEILRYIDFLESKRQKPQR